MWSIPRYGIVGAAWSTLLVLLVSRGLVPAVLFCRYNGSSLARFLGYIYGVPTLTALPVGVAAYWLRQTILPGRNWPELVAAGAIISILFISAAFRTCLEPEHRQHAIDLISAAVKRVQSNKV
jgi:hypothetical protein